MTTRIAFSFSLFALIAFATAPPAAQVYEWPLGVGIVHPPLDPDRPLLLYAAPPIGTLPALVSPTDSVTFSAGAHHIDIAYAPPWFDAEMAKLDYDLLTLRALTLTPHWIEVAVNGQEPLPRTFPRTMWVAREAVGFSPWSEFLLEVYSVEPITPSANPLYSGPSEQTARVGTTEGRSYHPRAVQGCWIRVEDTEARETDSYPGGWLRWCDGDALLVRYNLLS